MNGEIVSQMYAYDWIPFYSVLVLTLVELATVLNKNVKARIEKKQEKRPRVELRILMTNRSQN